MSAEACWNQDRNQHPSPNLTVMNQLPIKKRIFTPKEETVVFLKGLTDKLLKNEECNSVAAKFPLPSCDPAHPPELDEAMVSFIPKSAKTNDRFLSKLQQFSMNAMGPLLFLHEHLASESPDLDRSRSAVKSSLSLLANAASHFSVERRKSIMKNLNNDLKPLADGDYPDRDPLLFGEGFAGRAKAAAD